MQIVSVNHFVIQANQPNTEVSWQITGVRNDKHMQKNKFKAEVVKNKFKTGKYLDPESWNQPLTKGILNIETSKGKVLAKPVNNLSDLGISEKNSGTTATSQPVKSVTANKQTNINTDEVNGQSGVMGAEPGKQTGEKNKQ